MQVGAGRQSRGADLADDITRRDHLAGCDVHAPEVAVEQPYVVVDNLNHVDARSSRIKSGANDAGCRRVDRRARTGRQVDSGVKVETGTERIERLEGEGRAAEWQRLDATGNDGRQRQPVLDRHARCSHAGGEQADEPERVAAVSIRTSISMYTRYSAPC